MTKEKIIVISVTVVLSAVIWFAFDKAFEFMDWEDYQFTAMMLITVLWKIVLDDLKNN